MYPMPSVDTDVVIDEKLKVELSEPKRYKVIFINDDKTPVEFVIDLLIKIFKHSEENSKQITLTVHNEGSAVAGVYAFEIAEQKALESMQLARKSGFPLQVEIEQE